MIIFIIIVVIGAVSIYFMFFNKTEVDSNSDTLNGQTSVGTQVPAYREEDADFGSLENVIPQIKRVEVEPEYLFDEQGKKYHLIIKTRQIPRRTYIIAQLQGKYWGEINENFTCQFEYSQFYDFNIYEANLTQATYQATPFDFTEDEDFPKEKLPRLLPITLESKSFEYEVNLHEPKFASITFNRKLHQSEGSEVFGTIESIVTGYILDFIPETYEERQYIDEYVDVKGLQPTGPLSGNFTSINRHIKDYDALASGTIHDKRSGDYNRDNLKKTYVATGNVEHSGNYQRSQFYYSNYKSTYWSDWKYNKDVKVAKNGGCLGSVFDIIGFIFCLAFFLLMLPQMVAWIPFLIIFWLLSLIPGNILRWGFQAIGLLLIIGLAWSFLNFLKAPASVTAPKPALVRQEENSKADTEQIIDSEDKKVRDTIIRHFRAWEDYDGNIYEGMIWTRKSDYSASSDYKNNFQGYGNSRDNYDKLIYLLKENDKSKLGGIFQLFDKIDREKRLSRENFAEMIVSFVQDIPYALILPQECDPELYADPFIKNYLNSPDAICEAYQPTGINSPVEFMSNLKGDCDTRTLLLYTILSYYKYDVALLSSEHYQHSLIGINLPIEGIAYQYDLKRYVLWETTAPNVRPGVLATEISNLNYWRISLKST